MFYYKRKFDKLILQSRDFYRTKVMIEIFYQNHVTNDLRSTHETCRNSRSSTSFQQIQDLFLSSEGFVRVNA